MIHDNALNIFTDGSSLRSPRSGGIGVRFVLVDPDGQEQVQDVQFLGYQNATNNQMELQACIAALREARRLDLIRGPSHVVLYTDSLYVVDNIKKAMFEWPKTKWHSRRGRPILNADLWKQLVSAVHKVGKRVEFKWVKGHSKSHHNKAVDKMARDSARLAYNKPLTVAHVRRKHSPASVDIGSVPMEGQRLSIHIIKTEYLRIQRVWKCNYEVVSKRSKYYPSVDIIFSDTLLKAGHTYFVKVNEDTQNPRIVKVFREIIKKPPGVSTR